jgi:hypothetical protein
VKDIVNPIASVNQADMVADHDVTVSPRRRSKTGIQVTGHRSNGSSHFAREYKSFSNIWLPFLMPIPTLIVPKSVVMIPVPIACGLAIMVVKPVVIVMIPIMMIPILRILTAIILIVMVPTILILRLSQRYAQK